MITLCGRFSHSHAQRENENHRIPIVFLIFSLCPNPTSPPSASPPLQPIKPICKALAMQTKKNFSGKWHYSRAVVYAPSPSHHTPNCSRLARLTGVWDMASGELQQTLQGHKGWVRSVAFECWKSVHLNKMPANNSPPNR